MSKYRLQADYGSGVGWTEHGSILTVLYFALFISKRATITVTRTKQGSIGNG